MAADPIPSPPGAGLGWALRMAWNDSRGKRRTLGLFMLCIVFGVGALVALQSFRTNVSTTIDEEARTLLGADLAIFAFRPFSDEADQFLNSIEGEQTRETRFRSMAFFPEVAQSRLVQVRAYTGHYPFYGDLETDPVLTTPVHESAEPIAVVEESILVQVGAEVGDTLRLGELEFRVAAKLVAVDGESEVASLFSPRVMIGAQHLEATGLVREGSVTRYTAWFELPEGLGEELATRIEEAEATVFATEGLRATTVEDRRQGLAQAFDRLTRYLNLIGFIALLLGGIGVGGAVQVYLRDKTPTVALMRCVGVPMRTAFAVYLTQVLVVGFLGAVLGAVAGVGVQFLLPAVLGAFLPFDVDVALAPFAIASSLGFGWVVAVLFALLPLLAIRRISPLAALRADIELPAASRKDVAVWIVRLVLAGLVLGFSMVQTGSAVQGLYFAGGLGAALLVLMGLAFGLRASLRHLLPKRASYAARMGLSNLYRPNNRTVFLVVTLGMGAFLINTLFLVKDGLLAEVERSTRVDQPNLVLFDIQQTQRDAVIGVIEETGLPVIDAVPVVSMRPSAIKGRTISELRADPESQVEDWVYTWEFRVSYRDEMLANESIAEGVWMPEYDTSNPSVPVPISISDNLLEDLDVGLGDSITWSIFGIPIETEIASIRNVEWESGQLNFGIVFPTGVLEEAPVQFAMLSRSPDRTTTGQLQQALGNAHPNVSVLDLSLVFDSLNELLGKVAFVIRFMAFFTVATGLVVLVGAVLTSRYQRMREAVLLRTIGASGGFVRRTMAVEFALVGALAGLAGIILSVGASWALSAFVFETGFTAPWLELIGALTLTALLTLGTGLATSRGISSQPPLVVLRTET